MTKKTKIIIFFSLTLTVILGFVFIFLIISNLRGPLNNEYLSENESNFVDSLTKTCSCEVRIQKSLRVERDNENNGTLFITLNYNNSKTNFCLLDSLILLENAKKVFFMYENILTNKKSYKIIDIQYYSSEFGDRSETPTCDRIFSFDIETKKYFDYSESNRYLRIKQNIH